MTHEDYKGRAGVMMMIGKGAVANLLGGGHARRSTELDMTFAYYNLSYVYVQNKLLRHKYKP